MDSNGGISDCGNIPWKLKGDQKRLADFMQPKPITDDDGNLRYEYVAIIVGRNTFEMMPFKNPTMIMIDTIDEHGVNITKNIGGSIKYFVLSSKRGQCVSKNGVIISSYSEDEIMQTDLTGYDRVIVLGGTRVWSLFHINRWHITQLAVSWQCDTILTLPAYLNNAHKEVVIEDFTDRDDFIDRDTWREQYFSETYTVTVYTSVNKEWSPNDYEQQYIGLVRNRIDYGSLDNNRTGTPTYALFGGINGTGGAISVKLNGRRQTTTMSSLLIPLLTTKKMGIKTVFTELCWFLNGDTDITWLNEHGVHIWDSDSKRHGNSQLGKVYGYQWRKYGSCVDQVAECVRLIREDPTSRRIIINSWNPCDLPDMALPPCHVLYQFHVRVTSNGNYLSCKMYQRSADLGLGVPFNIASVALLTHIMARVTGTIAERVEISFGNAHVYADHVAALNMQTMRVIKQPPIICFTDDAPMNLLCGSWQPHHISLKKYTSSSAVKMHMSGGM
jgi:thymidylate synthase